MCLHISLKKERTSVSRWAWLNFVQHVHVMLVILQMWPHLLKGLQKVTDTLSKQTAFTNLCQSPTGCATSCPAQRKWLQVAHCDIHGFGVALLPSRKPQREKRGRFCGKETHDPRPPDPLRGRWRCLEKASLVASPPSLLHSQTSGNAGDTDTQVRWSEPSIAGEPVLPTPTAMRTHSTRWARRRQNLLLGLNQGKDLNILLAPLGRPGAAKCSTCHIHESRIGPSMTGLRSNRGRRRQETTESTDATSTIAFGPWV
jgi:hypothetical protein